jgi:hypothetical protein
VKQHKIGDEVSFELAMGGCGTGQVVGMRASGQIVFYVVRTPKGNEHTFLGQDLYTPTPKPRKTVRSIARKLGDLAEAAGDDELYERRFDRLKPQIETLAVMAIIGLHRDVTIAAVNSSPRRDELLASALVGDWDRVNQILGDVRANTTAPLNTDPAPRATVRVHVPQGPLTAQIELEPRDPSSPFNFPCCGGLRPAHTSNCREA